MEFQRKSYLDDYSVNEEAPGNHLRYRLARDRMQAVKTTAVSYRVTCKFLTRENVTDRDYLEGRLSAWNIIEEKSNAACRHVTYVNIEMAIGAGTVPCFSGKRGLNGICIFFAAPGCDMQPSEYVSNKWEQEAMMVSW
ncbi:predicted protein [Nematostella vectensis]|uniref:Uncharacterized protein n=1 Tax=Nematostella vectensis TaxID=45351 RepID=A7S1R3_NEMVE|nr:predicted protein [Nematostella vectensis]|eukprot:XP_001634476.1 predicted protein [Nematostella vectensis]